MTTTTVHPAVAADRRARRKRWADTAERQIHLFLAVVLGGWFFMLGIGIVHHDWIPDCPTLGWGTSTLLAALFRGALAPLRPWKKDPSS